MNINGGIELTTFYIKEETLENMELLNKKTANDNDVFERKITFYSIDYIFPYGEKECMISSGCEEFFIKESYEFVNSKIKERMVFKFN